MLGKDVVEYMLKTDSKSDTKAIEFLSHLAMKNRTTIYIEADKILKADPSAYS